MNTFVKNIISGVLVIVLAGIISPSKAYSKQIKLLCSLIFTCMLIGSILGIVRDYSNELTVYFNENASYEERGDAYKDCMSYVLTEYKQNISADIIEKLNRNSIYVDDVIVDVTENSASEDFGSILSVELSGCDEAELKSAKKIINSFYNVEYENIYN